MSSFNQVTIGGFPDGGLVNNKKPLFLNDNAFTSLENALVFRYRVKKREGTVLIGQLQRNVSVTGQSLTADSINLKTALSLEPNSTISLGSINITGVTDGTLYTDPLRNGTLTATGGTGTGGTINYATGILTINGGGNQAITGTIYYSPNLPCMGICRQDIATIGIDNTIFFDTTYAYQYTGGQFQEFNSISATTWTGNQYQFFWYANYQGADPSLRYFFATNNNINDPMRYYGAGTWTDFIPILADNPPSATQIRLFQALILIPYYGRLLALNTWEGPNSTGPGGASNFFARCRFSQIGDPTSVDAWRADQFGKGGFLDAPTNESIVSAAFFRNTLIVYFEYSTWQLRYIGEYGLPFIFERVSSDFGCVSTYSSIVFDEGVLTVSDRGIISGAASGIRRIDDVIPDTAFGFKKTDNAPNYVHGVRDFGKELVYWNYLDTTNSGEGQTFPNTVLLYNYQNNTWAQYRDSITCFGTVQFEFGITWDSDTVIWDDESVTWDTPNNQNDTVFVCAGNQQGFISVYENQSANTNISSPLLYAPSLSIMAVDTTVIPAKITSVNHNLEDGELIYISGALWDVVDPLINNTIFQSGNVTQDTFTLSRWTGMNYGDVELDPTAIYIGGGMIALIPKMNVVGKDFNPYQAQGKQFKISYIDFQVDSDESVVSIPALTIQLFVNSYLGEQANIGGNEELLVNSSLTSGFIQNITQEIPANVTSTNHSLRTGSLIRIADVKGMTEVNSEVSNLNYSVTVVDANNFTLDDLDSTLFTAYTTGGIYNVLPKDGTPYQTGSQYAWYRFYATQYGQYLRVGITYDDALMNQIQTHQSSFELNAMNFFFREGGRLIN